MNILYERAKKLYGLGWSPVANNGKSPLIKRWTELGRTHSPQLISPDNWPGNDLTAVAVYLGEDVIDLDIEFDCPEVSSLIETLPLLKSAPIVKTSRGFGILLRCPDFVNKVSQPGFWEIRTGKMQRHIYGEVGGHQYHFINHDIIQEAIKPTDLPTTSIEDIADLIRCLMKARGYSVDIKAMDKLYRQGTATLTEKSSLSVNVAVPREAHIAVPWTVSKESDSLKFADRKDTTPNSLEQLKECIFCNSDLASQLFTQYKCDLPGPNEFFKCPFHGENNPSVTWCIDETTGYFVFQDWHGHSDGNVRFNIVECYAAFETGDLERFDTSTLKGKGNLSHWLTKLVMQFDMIPQSIREEMQKYDRIKKEYINYINSFPLLTNRSKEILVNVYKRLIKEYKIGIITNRPFAGISTRYLGLELGIDDSMVNKALNYLCCIGFAAKTPTKSSHAKKRPDRYTINCNLNYKEAEDKVLKLELKSLKKLNQNTVAKRLGEDIATSVFRRQSDSWEAIGKQPFWHPDYTPTPPIQEEYNPNPPYPGELPEENYNDIPIDCGLSEIELQIRKITALPF